MLNRFKSKINQKQDQKSLKDNVNFNGKDFPSSTREWKNSVYFYNKNALSLIPEASKLTIKLLKNYLNFYLSKIENKIRRKVKLNNKKRKISLNKIYVNKGEFKHTHNKVVITLFIYNRQNINYLYKLNKGYLKFLGKNKFKQDLILIKNRGLDLINDEITQKNIVKSILVKKFYDSSKSDIFHIMHKNYATKNYIKFLRKTLYKLVLYLQYKQLMYINKSKFEYTYLKGLINFIKKIFNKNVEFNIINLKYFYLNSDIFTQPLALKISKNKRKLLKYFKTFVRKVKIPSKNLSYLLNNSNIGKRNNINSLFNYIKNVDPINNLIYKLYLNDDCDGKLNSLKKTVIETIKYKKVTGVRLEAKGRLSKRTSAARSIWKVKYKGNLKNGYSSYRSLSSVMLRGNFKSNLQYTNINSRSRLGTFGFKGWVSGS